MVNGYPFRRSRLILPSSSLLSSFVLSFFSVWEVFAPMRANSFILSRSHFAKTTLSGEANRMSIKLFPFVKVGKKTFKCTHAL